MTLDALVAEYKQRYPYTTRSEAEIRQACIDAAEPSCAICHASGPDIGLEWHFSGTRHRAGDRYIRCISREDCANRQEARRAVVS